VLPGESLAKYSGPAGEREQRTASVEAESESHGWSENSAEEREPLEPAAEERQRQEALGGLGLSEPDADDDAGELGHSRSRPEYEREVTGGEEDSVQALARPGDDTPYSQDDVGVAIAKTYDDEEDEDEDNGEEDDDSEDEEDESMEFAAADDDVQVAETEDGQMALDPSETAEVREAIREAIEETAAGQADVPPEAAAEDEERDEPQPGAQRIEEGEGGPMQARLRGRGGDSRYVHRRGGRRGRRRGRFRGMAEPVAETESSAGDSTRPSPASITELLGPGEEILVQISKEPLGKKGARITSHIAMPGRYLVYMPTVDHVGVSRKIANDNERLRLRRIVQTHRTGMSGGFIVRTAGSGASEEEIRGDMLFLYNLWLDIRQKAEQRPAPSLIHQDLDVVERVLRDQLGSDFKTMWVDSEGEYERILRFVERFQPNLLSRVKLYTRSKPIFDAFNITPELEKALRPKVWLKSGGYIVINQTEALVAIDVNTGKFVGKSDRLEDTIVKTNLEAVQEIVRQIRLRDLGGIIVVDFIDMDDRKNRYKVAQALEQELRLDRAPSKSLQFNEFGLVAITRKRVKQSLERTLCTACPYCTGSGFVKSLETVIFEILNEAKKMAPRVRSRKDLTIRVNPEVARALKARENTYLQEIEEIFRANILVRGDVSLHREHFDIN
jgi:ribonuclease G